MNVMFVTRRFQDQAVYWNTKELTLETNLINVMLVRNDFPDQAVF